MPLSPLCAQLRLRRQAGAAPGLHAMNRNKDRNNGDVWACLMPMHRVALRLVTGVAYAFLPAVMLSRLQHQTGQRSHKPVGAPLFQAVGQSQRRLSARDPGKSARARKRRSEPISGTTGQPCAQFPACRPLVDRNRFATISVRSARAIPGHLLGARRRINLQLPGIALGVTAYAYCVGREHIRPRQGLSASAMPMPAERFLDIQDAALAIGRSTDTIRRLIRAGRLPGARRASHLPNAPWLIPSSSLRAEGRPPSQAHRSGAVPAERRVAAEVPADAIIQELRGQVAAQADQIRELHRTVRELASAFSALAADRSRP